MKIQIRVTKIFALDPIEAWLFVLKKLSVDVIELMDYYKNAVSTNSLVLCPQMKQSHHRQDCAVSPRSGSTCVPTSSGGLCPIRIYIPMS